MNKNIIHSIIYSLNISNKLYSILYKLKAGSYIPGPNLGSTLDYELISLRDNTTYKLGANYDIIKIYSSNYSYYQYHIGAFKSLSNYKYSNDYTKINITNYINRVEKISKLNTYVKIISRLLLVISRNILLGDSRKIIYNNIEYRSDNTCIYIEYNSIFIKTKLGKQPLDTFLQKIL